MVTSLPQDALSLLRHDHRALHQLFLTLEESDDSGEQQMAMGTLIAHWTRHAKLEKDVFYPAVRRATGNNQGVDQAEETLDDIESIVQDIREIDPEDPLYSDKLTEFEDKVQQHILDDEGDLYSLVEQTTLNLEEVGMALHHYKSQ